MARLLLVRHAQSEWNAAGRWQGVGDPPLSPAGREAAGAAVERLRGTVELVVSSPQLRAKQTAEIIASGLDIGHVEFEPDLREIDVGAWTGLTIAQVEERYPDEIAAWRAGTAVSAPGGEDRASFLRRCLDALDRIAGVHDGRAVLIVTHGGVIGTLERHLEVDPRRGVGHLHGRWFASEGGLRSLSDRIAFAGPTEPATEAR